MIAFSYYSTPNDVSGVSTWLAQLAVWLKGQGYELVFHLQYFGADVRDSTLARTLAQHEIPFEIVHRSIYTEENLEQVMSFLNRYRPRLYFPQCIHTLLYAGMIGGRHGLPWVYTMHADDPYYWDLATVLDTEQAGGRVVCVSDHLESGLRRRGLAERPWNIPCGVSMPTRLARFRTRPFRVVYSGRVVERQKRIGLVLETLLAACRLSPQLEGLVIGEGDGLAQVQAQVRESPFRDRIHFTGRLSPEEVRALLPEAQALLLMSDFEGMPVAVLEAMAAGVVPVVRYIDSGLPQIIHEGRSGCWCSDDPEEAARVLVRLSEDPERWETLSAGARRQVVEGGFDMEPNFRRWQALIDELLETARPQYPLPGKDTWGLPPVPAHLERIDTRLPAATRGGVHHRFAAALGGLLAGIRHARSPQRNPDLRTAGGHRSLTDLPPPNDLSCAMKYDGDSPA